MSEAARQCFGDLHQCGQQSQQKLAVEPHFEAKPMVSITSAAHHGQLS